MPREKYAELGARYRYHYLQHQDDLVLFDGVLPMLDALQARGHKLAVATGKSRRGLDEALATVALRERFDASRTADETFGKPHPRMLLELMEEMEVPAERTLMIGDTTHDLQLAINAGCASVGVSYGAHEPETFDALQPLHVAHSVSGSDAVATRRTHENPAMSESIPLCNAADLVEGGRAVPFDVVHRRPDLPGLRDPL